MIKLIDLLENKISLSPEEKKIASKLATQEEREQYIKALAVLHKDKEESLEEGLGDNLKDELKKLGLKAAVITALLGTPSVTSAQKTDLKNIKPAVTQTVDKKTNADTLYKKDIQKVQAAIKVYRYYSINDWKAGKIGIHMHGISKPEANPDRKSTRLNSSH